MNFYSLWRASLYRDNLYCVNMKWREDDIFEESRNRTIGTLVFNKSVNAYLCIQLWVHQYAEGLMVWMSFVLYVQWHDHCMWNLRSKLHCESILRGNIIHILIKDFKSSHFCKRLFSGWIILINKKPLSSVSTNYCIQTQVRCSP